jgi:hypothetical protein
MDVIRLLAERQRVPAVCARRSAMRIVVINHVTLDGVMQGPGRADEDTRDGFTHGGRAEPNTDDVMGNAWGKRLSASGGLLLGRRTYR